MSFAAGDFACLWRKAGLKMAGGALALWAGSCGAMIADTADVQNDAFAINSSDAVPANAGYTTHRRAYHNDFDGDGRADAWSYDEQSGMWYFIFSREPDVLRTLHFGGPGALACPEDYDGDGKYDPCVFWRSEDLCLWEVKHSANGYVSAVYVGQKKGLPITGDYDGDGHADFVMLITEMNLYRLVGLMSRQLYAVSTAALGSLDAPGYLPAAADFDGDGLTDPGVYNEETGHWVVALSARQHQLASAHIGGPGNVPVQADYDGDQKADPIVYGLNDGLWKGYLSAGGYHPVSAKFGAPGFLPNPGDYDNDGISDLAVMTADKSELYVLKSTEGFSVIPFQTMSPPSSPAPAATSAAAVN